MFGKKISEKERLLREFPFLWATQTDWAIDTKIVINRPSNYQTLMHFEIDPTAFVAECFIHIVSAQSEHMNKIRVEGTYHNPPQVFDALLQVEKTLGWQVRDIKHFVWRSPNYEGFMVYPHNKVFITGVADTQAFMEEFARAKEYHAERIRLIRNMS